MDDLDKAERLITDMKAALPLQARLSPAARSMLLQHISEGAIPERCQVVSIFYMGEEGGIVCGLDIGGPDTKSLAFISITHLAFDRRCPLFRPIDAYQRHRTKSSSSRRGGATELSPSRPPVNLKRLCRVRPDDDASMPGMPRIK